ncbi:pumilio homolog 24 isoform X1 [Morus notabilis]|uniref:pumilio homolog 24 isoform X1 n=1 Tax=Morus notabilis TaxID=981085 RepID=UPI000CED2AAE|nr:pumilio homolog 24 isoform X1 [Morus notabilis]
MAAKDQQKSKPMKRKQISSAKPESGNSISKKPKFVADSKKPSNDLKHVAKKPFKGPKDSQSGHGNEKKGPMSTRERRLHAKELAEARKKKRKRHYTLEQDLAHLWEKMRRRNIAKEDRAKLVSEALEKMKGKISEIASSHVSSRVLQTCVKYCSQAEKDSVFEELQPHILTLATNTYAVHLVKKILDSASRKQLSACISSFHGHVASLLRHMVGSVVIEHAYQLGNATQKQELLMELYSKELQIFKDLVSTKESRLIDIISKLNLQKNSVIRHMTSVIQPILEKGIVDHSIIHRLLMEFFSIADKSSATEVIQQLSSPLLVRMIHTKDGSRIGMLCVKHGSAKERKKLLKGMKGFIKKIAHDQYGSLVLVCILSIVDDTKLVTKIVIQEVQENLEDLVLDKNGRRLLLHLLHPNCSRYFSPDDLASFDLSIPSLSSKVESNDHSERKAFQVNGASEEVKPNNDMEVTEAEAERSADPGETVPVVEGGKKDPSIRRQELLVKSGLAERLVGVCVENAGKLLRSNFGKEVIYKVATGGADGILNSTMEDKLDTLHKAIASLVAEPKSEESEEERVLENFHSSRTIRKLILDSPTFASTLWNTALKGKCETWAMGHSSKVISAYLESSDSKVQDLAKKELQRLIDRGILKIPEKQSTAEG